MCDDRPIGIFDSGIGGMSVLLACRRLMPCEKFVYLADEANMPYGTRPADEVRASALGCCAALVGMNCKAIAVACNTATEIAIDDIRRLYPNIVTVGLEPALKPCFRELGRNGYAVALVTQATARSKKFMRNLGDCEGRIKAAPQPELARRIETCTNIKELAPYVNQMLEPYRDAEAVVLGCSHYSHIAALIREFYGGKIKLYDGADGEAARLKYCLALTGGLAKSGGGSVVFYSTEKTKIFSAR